MSKSKITDDPEGLTEEQIKELQEEQKNGSN